MTTLALYGKRGTKSHQLQSNEVFIAVVTLRQFVRKVPGGIMIAGKHGLTNIQVTNNWYLRTLHILMVCDILFC